MNTSILEEKIMMLESSQRKLRKLLTICIAGFSMMACLMLTAFRDKNGQLIPEESILRLRGIILTDQHGIERMWLGAPVDQPITMGKRFNRGSTAHGIILLDEEGNERGSFAIHDESSTIALTMDNVSKMVYNLSTGPTGGVTERVLDKYGNSIVMGTGQSGAYLKLASKDSSLVFTTKKTAP